MAKKGFEDRGQGLGRREVLECMVWAGTGVLWAISGGVPHSVGLIGDAVAAEPAGFTFLQRRTRMRSARCAKPSPR